jgi:hypothetical protein
VFRVRGRGIRIDGERGGVKVGRSKGEGGNVVRVERGIDVTGLSGVTDVPKEEEAKRNG